MTNMIKRKIERKRTMVKTLIWSNRLWEIDIYEFY